MRSVLTAILLFVTFTGFGQATLQQSMPEELYAQGMDMMTNADYGSARQYFERYLNTGDNTYLERSEYNIAICALILYHLDGEQLMNNFIESHSTSQLALLAHFEMGTYFFRDKNYKKAIEHLESVNPKVLEAAQRQELSYKLGYSYFALRRFSKAIGYFNKLKATKGKYYVLSSYYAGYIEFELKEYDSAVKDLKVAAEDEALGNSVTAMLASVYYQQGSYQQLIDFLEPLAKSDDSIKKNTKLSILLAEAYFYTKQYTAAIEYYSIAEKNINKEASYNYAVALKNSNQMGKAIEVLKPIAGVSTDTEIAASYLLGSLYLYQQEKLYALGVFSQLMKSKEVKTAEESHYLAASLAFQLGRTTQSIESLKSFLSKYADSNHRQEVENLIARAYVETNDYAKAIEYIEGLTEKSLNVREAYQKATFLLGVEQFNNRKFRIAVQNFEKSIDYSEDKLLASRAHLYIAESYSLGRRYKEAESHYKQVLSSSLNKNSESYLLARFGMGYCLYNQQKYTDAKNQFNYFITSTNENNSKYGRALVRLADCNYVEKSYSKALGYYKKAINGVIKEKDYAYYQVGVIQHILSDYEAAIGNLNRVLSVFPSSPYWDDALFEKASIYLEQGIYDKAITAYSQLIIEKPRSRYVPYALEKRALANFNRKVYARTIADYELFLKNYPHHKSINNVLLGLQQAYSLDGRATDFNASLRRFKENNPDVEGLEAVEFDALKGYYNEGLYSKAEEGLRGFISNYPNDTKIAEARFILAEALYRQQKEKQALVVYYKVVEEISFDLMYRVYERIADIEYKNLRYDKSILYYKKLKQDAISENQHFRALQGMVKAYYFKGSYDSVVYLADQLLKAEGARNEFIVTATLYKGKSYFAKGNYVGADSLFRKTTLVTSNELGAEAQYYLGEIKHLQKDYDGSNEELYKIAQRYGQYSEWLDKAFLLVADNFMSKKEYFQAKATLQSIIDNSSSEITIAKAHNKMQLLIEKELGESQLEDTLQVEVIDTVAHE